MSESPPIDPETNTVAKNVVTLLSALLEEQLETFDEETLQAIKTLMARRANVHQIVYQDGLRKKPPANLVRSSMLSELYARVSFYAELIRKPPQENTPVATADEAASVINAVVADSEETVH